MIQLVINNSIMITWFLCILGLGMASNILSSIYLNVFTKHEVWDWKKFIYGLIKALLFCGSFYAFTVGATIVPIVLSQYGIVTEEVSEVLNITIIASLLVSTSIGEYKKTYDNWRETLVKRDTLDGDN